jgi:hypothetical protein
VFAAPQAGTTPLFRLFNGSNGDHVYTTSATDRTSWYLNANGQYVQVDLAGNISGAQPVGSRFGRARNALTETGVVDAVLVRGQYTYVFSGAEYFRYTGEAFAVQDEGYPKPIASNTEELPAWKRVDAAFTSPGGTAYFFSNELKAFVTSTALRNPRPITDFWGKEKEKDKASKDDKTTKETKDTKNEKATAGTRSSTVGSWTPRWSAASPPT